MTTPAEDPELAYAAATVALLRRLEQRGIDREVLADMTNQEQAAVFAAESRIRGCVR